MEIEDNPPSSKHKPQNNHFTMELLRNQSELSRNLATSSRL